MQCLEAHALQSLAHLRHGFFTREGGVSTGTYQSLNCCLGTRDRLEDVRENRRRAMAALKANNDNLTTLYQAHGNQVIHIATPLAPETRPEADAMVTACPDIPLGILTADCVPILFADTTRPVIGAAHAGWRGAAAGIVQATIEAMEQIGARRGNIVAAIGPSIAQASYEVGPDVAGKFPTRFARESDEGKFLLDLSGALTAQLAELGLKSIEHLPLDTLTDPRFFSCRRAGREGAPDFGRQLSVIMLADPAAGC